MVFKNIQRIKKAMPEVLHVVMYYNNGTVFQTTFEQNINIPKLGENLAEILEHIRKLYELCNFNFQKYNKLIFETDEISTIVLKLGEDSNIALFFKKEEDINLKLTAIKRYLTRIESLVDMNEKELLIQEILAKEEDLMTLKTNLQLKQELLSEKLDFREKIKEENKEEYDLLVKEIEILQDEVSIINLEIENLSNEITSFREKIERES